MFWVFFLSPRDEEKLDVLCYPTLSTPVPLGFIPAAHSLVKPFMSSPGWGQPSSHQLHPSDFPAQGHCWGEAFVHPVNGPAKTVLPLPRA